MPEERRDNQRGKGQGRDNSRGRGRGRRREREIPEFDQKVIDVARVARVVAGGRRFRFRATIAIGNKNGRVGLALAKGADVSQAIQKAVGRAKKSMVTIPLNGTTIPHEIQEKESGSVVLLKPAVPGTGIIAGGPVRAVIELAGIQDILSKMLGGSNKTNNAVATFNALKALRKPENIMALRGKELPKKFVKKSHVPAAPKAESTEEKQEKK
jgi:small subunit ribosomal protein S5